MAKRHRRFIRFTKTEYVAGQIVPVSAIYECSECENITAFKKGEQFTLCEHCQEQEKSWYRTNEFVHFVSKNLNTEFERIEGISLKTADKIAELSGTVSFVLFHILWFGFWIYANTGHSLFGISGFDPYPFGLLTMIVSLEAIILSTFILISQNRQAQKSELRAELDYQTNLNTEKDVVEILSILREIREEKRLSSKTDEVLEEANIRVTPVKRPRAKPARKKSRSRKIIEQAGIDVVNNDE